MAHTGNAAPPNPEHMLQEIRSSVQAGDAIKVQLVLNHLGDVEWKVQHQLIYELLRADAEFTIPQLNRLVTSYPELSATLPVIRETLISQLIAHPDLLVYHLRNPSITDKRMLIQLAEELRLEAAVPALIGVLGETDERETIGSVLAALGAIGGPQVLNTLTEFLYSSDRELTTRAIHALHQLRTPEAMTWLAERMGTDNELDLLIMGIFAEVQDDISLEKLADALRSSYTKMRVFAKEQLVRIGPRAVPVLLANLSDTNADFVIHALNVLGAIGDAQAVMPIRRLLSAEPPDANVRFAAYEALAQLPLAKGAFALAAGLASTVVNVLLVDFRSFDTLGEITVLAVVALTVYALLRRFRPAPESAAIPAQQRNEADPARGQTPAEQANSGYLMVAGIYLRLLLPFMGVAAVYFFMRGHNLPGGGFVAGLVFAVAILVQYMLAGTVWVESHLSLRPHRWLGLGLVLACATGLGAWLFGHPFLTTHTAHVTWPLVGELHLPSAFVFDLGVFTVVVGTTMLMLVALAHQSLRGHRLPGEDGAEDRQAAGGRTI